MDKAQVTVSIDDAHIEQIDQVAETLKTAGLDIAQILSTLGMVTGSVDADKLSSLSNVDGVDSVQVDKTYQLAPPDADIQ